MRIKLFENAALSKKVKAIELMLAGGGVIITAVLVKQFAAVAFGVFGLYRWLIRKKRGEGLVYIAISLVIFAVFNQSGLGRFLMNSIITGGGLMIVWGLILFLLNRKKTDDS